MNSELPCKLKGCAAIATVGEFCAVHAGMRKVTYSMNCAGCGKTIRAGAWHRHDARGARCYPACVGAGQQRASMLK